MIENTPELKVIDISGFKMPKEDEGYTSGEMLIRSRTKFKVLAIQKTEKNMKRRVVVLRPIEDDMVPPQAKIKNPFYGTLLE